jgi:hypothetical protein
MEFSFSFNVATRFLKQLNEIPTVDGRQMVGYTGGSATLCILV